MEKTGKRGPEILDSTYGQSEPNPALVLDSRVLHDRREFHDLIAERHKTGLNPTKKNLCLQIVFFIIMGLLKLSY